MVSLLTDLRIIELVYSLLLALHVISFSAHSMAEHTVQNRTRLTYLFPLFYLLTPYCGAYVLEYGHLSRPPIHGHFSFLHFFNKVIYFMSLLLLSDVPARTQKHLYHYVEQNI
jgi:hypothetical protein